MTRTWTGTDFREKGRKDKEKKEEKGVAKAFDFEFQFGIQDRFRFCI